ncbi:hypothetical protein [uncultured Psychroserpens sp.]|uniref:hypothetical protein n=1 Tax=uncultured Psychroserpens sp. TaxID=255436 RepID=UPI002631B0BB|nr:hypothetical protein [uncultured Psychroserpens sp.]
MKTLMCILAMIFLTKECEHKGTQAVAENNSIEELRVASVTQDSLTFTYRASTRGFFEIIWVNKDSISFANERDFKDKKSFAYSEEDWNELMMIYSTVDASQLSELEPPSTTFRHDEKPMAILFVDIADESYRTKGFDHGKPPKHINTLVNKLLSIKDKVVKQ